MLSIRHWYYWAGGAILLIISIPLVAYALETKSVKPQMQTSVQDVQIVDLKPKTESVQDLINKYSSEFGVNAAIPLKIARCESGYNTLAKNKNSSASGIFQFIKSTWDSTPEGKQGLSPFDADANVRAAIRKISEGGIGAWNASRSCWE